MLCYAVSRRENWSSLVSGGECMVKQYVYFTHVCTVSNYLPNVDYCCCVHDAGLLCCRYHQGWNHFRCVESDDLVDTLYVSASVLVLSAAFVARVRVYSRTRQNG